MAKATIVLTVVALGAWLLAEHQKALWLPLSQFREVGGGLFQVELMGTMFCLGLILQFARSYR